MFRMLIDRSGEAIQRSAPGFFGWTPLECFTLEMDANHGPLAAGAPSTGHFSIGLRLGHAYQYFTQD
jgi:hypothetical protein